MNAPTRKKPLELSTVWHLMLRSQGLSQRYSKQLQKKRKNKIQLSDEIKKLAERLILQMALI